MAILLRKVKSSDKKYFAKWWNDQDLRKLTSGRPGPILEKRLNKYFSMMNDKDNRDFMISLNRKPIGHIALAKRKDNWHETQIIIGEKKYWGKSYGTEAIKQLIEKAKSKRIAKIYLEVRPDNLRAIRAYKKCGFVGAGIKKYPKNKYLPMTLRMELKSMTIRKAEKEELSTIKFIYKKILKIYPFLTKAERNVFEEKSKSTFDKFKKNNITSEEAIKEFLSFLDGNGHADIREYRKPDRNFMRKVKPQRIPSFELRNHILYIKIPSWLIWLGKIDKKLNGFCQKNINKYDAIIIDVRENQGGSSRIAHNFAGIFFKKPVAYGKFIKMGRGKKLATITDELEPNGKFFIDKPIVILISQKCFSSNELFLAPFKISKRAVLVGKITAGGSAHPISEIITILGKKFVVRIPTWRFFLKGKKRPIEETKIRPDIFYKGKDIEKFAEKYLLKNLKKWKTLQQK